MDVLLRVLSKREELDKPLSELRTPDNLRATLLSKISRLYWRHCGHALSCPGCED